MDASAHILIVGNDEGLWEGVSAYLGLRGFSVTGRAKGREMDAAPVAGPAPAVAVLDINLPGESGLDRACRLRALPLAPGLPGPALAAAGEMPRPSGQAPLRFDGVTLDLDAGACRMPRVRT